jgi:methylmalonyl-CoA mutase cobalamin-binding domain/chain
MTDLATALRDLKEDQVKGIVEERLAKGDSPLQLVEELNQGMVAVGELFSEKKYFISQLIFSGEVLKNVMAKLEPMLAGGGETASKGKVVIGTVKGDIHDIGKNIVASLLKGSGFEVIDLGVDVPAEKFVQAVQESGAKALGLSALLNFTYPEMKNVVDSLTQAGLRDQVRVLIGGAPCNDQVKEFTGADYYAPDAVAGVNICKEIYG